MKFYQILITGIALIFFQVTFASDMNALNSVEKILAKPNVITGNFKQKREMQLLDKPLISSGHFELSKKSGFRLSQTTPFDSQLIVTSNKIEQQMMDNPPTVIRQREQPAIFTFTQVFLSIFQGKTDALLQYFNIDFKGTTDKWQISLTPKGSPLNKVITSITLEGGQTISNIMLVDNKQNKMTLELFDVKTK